MLYINRYCIAHELPLPMVELRADMDEAAMCFPDTWGWWENGNLPEIGERTRLHELAHLIVRKEDRWDSITHGPKFRTKELEIENWIRDERRRDLRTMRTQHDA